MDLVLYSDEDLPENVSMRQAILGFDHETPVKGVLSSNFGYRDHPLEGTERFHYGVDLAADTGTAIACFADGTVTAVGESSSYGKYCTVTHANGCTTLYAHCGRISVSSGAAVKKGEAGGGRRDRHGHRAASAFRAAKGRGLPEPDLLCGNRLSVPSPAAFFCWWDGSPSAAVGRRR